MVDKICKGCGRTYLTEQPSRSQFCSRDCMLSHAPSRQIVSEDVECPRCGVTRTLRGTPRALRREKRVCRSCADDAHAGPGNSQWRGGHQHWSSGRFGRDKDSLSWKAQRQLAWERDKYTCQECGKHKDGWKPDVHHINPFRASQSHALENLKCLCRKCHLRLEATVQANWGGNQLVKQHKPRTCPYCSVCDCRIHGPVFIGPRSKPVCHDCKGPFLVAQAMALAAQGLASKDIAELMGVSRMTAYYYSQGYRSNTAKRLGIKTDPITVMA